jgi:lauroyl/myristoyl acyltransferase
MTSIDKRIIELEEQVFSQFMGTTLHPSVRPDWERRYLRLIYRTTQLLRYIRAPLSFFPISIRYAIFSKILKPFITRRDAPRLNSSMQALEKHLGLSGEALQDFMGLWNESQACRLALLLALFTTRREVKPSSFIKFHNIDEVLNANRGGRVVLAGLHLGGYTALPTILADQGLDIIIFGHVKNLLPWKLSSDVSIIKRLITFVPTPHPGSTIKALQGIRRGGLLLSPIDNVPGRDSTEGSVTILSPLFEQAKGFWQVASMTDASVFLVHVLRVRGVKRSADTFEVEFRDVTQAKHNPTAMMDLVTSLRGLILSNPEQWSLWNYES